MRSPGTAQSLLFPLKSADSMETGVHNNPPGRLRASLIYTQRQILKIKGAPEQLSDVLTIPVIFTVIFTYLFGGAIAGDVASYLSYVLPGTLAMTLVLMTSSTGVALNTDIAKGVFDRFRTMPTWRPAPLVGALIADALRYSLAALLVIAMGLAMGYRPPGGVEGVAATVGLLLVFNFSISWLWLILGLVARAATTVQTYAYVFLVPLSFASNVFVDPATMPRWLGRIVADSPISHLVTASRSLMNGPPNISEIAFVIVGCVVFTGVFIPLAVLLYLRRGVK